MEGEEASIPQPLYHQFPNTIFASVYPFPVAFQREALWFPNCQQKPLATDIPIIPSQNDSSCSPLLLALIS